MLWIIIEIIFIDYYYLLLLLIDYYWSLYEYAFSCIWINSRLKGILIKILILMIMFLVATERKMKSSPLWISQKFIKIITIRSCISSLNILPNVWITCTFLLKHFKFTVMSSFYVVCHFSCKSRAKCFIRKRKKPSNTTIYLNGHRGASDNPCRNSPSAHYGISAPRDIAFSRIAPDLTRRRQDRPWREVSLCEWQDPAHRRVIHGISRMYARSYVRSI